MVRSADGKEYEVDDLVYDYYGMNEGVIVSEPDDQGWFYLGVWSDGHYSRELRNGERVCSLEHAQKMGWLMEPVAFCQHRGCEHTIHVFGEDFCVAHRVKFTG